MSHMSQVSSVAVTKLFIVRVLGLKVYLVSKRRMYASCRILKRVIVTESVVLSTGRLESTSRVYIYEKKETNMILAYKFLKRRQLEGIDG